MTVTQGPTHNKGRSFVRSKVLPVCKPFFRILRARCFRIHNFSYFRKVILYLQYILYSTPSWGGGSTYNQTHSHFCSKMYKCTFRSKKDYKQPHISSGKVLKPNENTTLGFREQIRNWAPDSNYHSHPTPVTLSMTMNIHLTNRTKPFGICT